MRKLIYKVDLNKTCECLWFFKKEWYEGWLGTQTVFIKIPKSITTFKKLKDWLASNFPESELNLLAKNLQSAWNTINNKFFKKVEEITENRWKHKIYFCFVQHAVVGNYHPLEDNVVFISTKNFELKDKLGETAEELIHQHYWNIWKKVFKNVRFPWRSLKAWLLSEMIAELILSEINLPLKIKKIGLFPQTRSKLKQLWIGRESFENFLIEAHSLKLKDEIRSLKFGKSLNIS